MAEQTDFTSFEKMPRHKLSSIITEAHALVGIRTGGLSFDNIMSLSVPPEVANWIASGMTVDFSCSIDRFEDEIIDNIVF